MFSAIGGALHAAARSAEEILLYKHWDGIGKQDAVRNKGIASFCCHEPANDDPLEIYIGYPLWIKP